MSRKIEYRNAILCDYVANGEGNKHVLVNTYHGDVFPSEFPANLMLGVYVEFNLAKLSTVTMRLNVDIDEARLASITAEVQKSEGEDWIPVVIPRIGFRLEVPKVLKITAERENFTPTLILEKGIRLLQP